MPGYTGPTTYPPPPVRARVPGRRLAVGGYLGGTGDGMAATRRIDGLVRPRATGKPAAKPNRPSDRLIEHARYSNGDPDRPTRRLAWNETPADAARKGWYPLGSDGRPLPDDWTYKASRPRSPDAADPALIFTLRR